MSEGMRTFQEENVIKFHSYSLNYKYRIIVFSPFRYCSTSQKRQASGEKTKAWACSAAFCKTVSILNTLLASYNVRTWESDITLCDHFWLRSTFSSLFHGASSMLTFARVTCLNAVRKWLQMSKAKPSMVLTYRQTQNVFLISSCFNKIVFLISSLLDNFTRNIGVLWS